MENGGNMIFEDPYTDYKCLSEDVLARIVLDDDPFAATSALAEIRRRDEDFARDLSLRILNRSNVDKYLQASAVTVLIPSYFGDLYDFVVEKIESFDDYVVNSMMSDICDEIAVIDKENDVFMKICSKMCEYVSDLKGVDEDVKMMFLEYYCQ